MFVYSSLWSAASMAALALFVQHALGLDRDLRPAGLLLCSAMFIYNLDHVIDSRVQRIPDDTAQRYFRHPATLLLLVASAILTGYFVSIAPPAAKWVFAAYTVVGLLYGFPLVPSRWRRSPRRYRLKDIPHIKAWLVSAMITLGVIGLPLYWQPHPPATPLWPLALFIYVLVATNALLFDIRDLPSDRAARVPTLPVAIGVRRTKHAVMLLNLVLLTLFAWGWGRELTSATPEIMLSIAAVIVCVMVVRVTTSRAFYGVIVDGCSYLPMVFVLLHQGFDGTR